MKSVYCSECGTRLMVSRKAMPKYGTIIDIIPPHECPEEMVELDLAPSPVPIPATGKFVEKLNELNPTPAANEVLDGPGDRRPAEFIKKEISSSAPSSLQDLLKNKGE